MTDGKIHSIPFRLGFGLMRLPKNADGTIDIPQVCDMADRFIAAGGTYFDTAYVYDDGLSEAAFKAAVADRYPREAYTVATKLNAWKGCHDEASAKQQFYTSLERTGAGYIDYYLLHALQRNNYAKYDEYHLWDFVKEQKTKAAKSKRTYEGMDYKFMEDYIATFEDETMVKAYKAVKQMAEDCGTKAYPLVKKWFLAKFSDMEGVFDMDAAKKDIADFRIAKAQASILEVVSEAAAEEQDEDKAS